MRYGKLSGLALGLGLLLAACGGKEEVKNNEEALKKAAEIQKGIEDYLVMMEGPTDIRVLSHDKVAVALPESGDFYLVTIDGVKMGRKDAGFLQIGQIGYKLVAKDAKTYTASDLKIANVMPFMDKDGKQAGALKLTPGRFSAEWSSELQAFLAFDFQATELQASDTDNRGDVRAKLLSWKHEGADKGGGVSDMTGTLALEGFTAKDTTDGTLAMDKLAGKFSVSGLKMAVYMEQLKKLRDVMAKISAMAEADAKAAADGSNAAAQPAAPKPELSEADRKALADYVQSIPQMFSAFLYQFDVAGLKFTEADGKTPFALGSAGLSFGASGIDAPKAQFDIVAKHDGLVLSDPEFDTPLIKAVLPTSGDLGISLVDIPTPKLLDALSGAIPNMLSGDPAIAEAAGKMLEDSLKKLLQESDIKLKVNPSGWTADLLTLKANGDFVVNPQAVKGAVGTLNLALTGLDDLIKLTMDPSMQAFGGGEMIGMLQMFQAMAKRETGSDGKPVDNFKIDVKPTGETTVNDQPLPF